MKRNVPCPIASRVALDTHAGILRTSDPSFDVESRSFHLLVSYDIRKGIIIRSVSRTPEEVKHRRRMQQKRIQGSRL